MEESPSSNTLDGRITAIKFSLASRQEICKSSISDCPISHSSQLTNPFLGLPLEVGKCESCGTSEPGQCEGHFGYIELPIPIYHPDHVGELKRILSVLCLKCLKMKTGKIQDKNVGVLERMLSCCEVASQVSVHEVKTVDGACYLELKLPSRTRDPESIWSFLEKYGYHYGQRCSRPLLPSEVMTIFKKVPADTRRKLSAKGYFLQDGYILHYLPVPPNCLSVPDISDGTNIMSTDYSISLLKKVLRQIEVIKTSRSGIPNFESHHIEANDLQSAVAQYFEFRGTGKASRDVDSRFGVSKESSNSSTKAWLEKMKTLFIRKGSGFSSRSVITGDPYKGVNEIGLPYEIAQKITFEERVSQHNIEFLQKLVDKKLCLTYRDGLSTYSLREGSKGHTFLRPGQVVHRRIMDGDMVFINRPPTTHKHSLQALSVYIHDDHTVKINPLICGPLSADFDGDCIHLFYPQSLSARAEVVELFSVEKQLLSSHTGNFNLQLASDSLLSLKLMFRKYFFGRAAAEQLAMFVPTSLPRPAVIKSPNFQAFWTVLQMLQTALPPFFDCSGDRFLTCKSEMVKIDTNRDTVQSIFIDIVTSILFSKHPKEVLRFFDSLTPLLMENLYMEGFSICLEDFYIPKSALNQVQEKIQNVSSVLYYLRSTQSESIQLQLDNYLREVKLPILNFAIKSSAIGYLIDSKSDSALNKVVQQIGFLGMQISDKGKFYTKTLVKDMAELFRKKYPSRGNYPSEEFGLVRSCLFNGLDPYQEMLYSISSREVIVRSTRGLTEPGTLFKNLMAILRDVVICYDGTVRNLCSNSIIQFEYGANHGMPDNNEFSAGEPVGVLAATAMSNPAYKAVLDSSPSSNSSWDMMKEILLCGVSFKNDLTDRRVVLYLNDCQCGRKYCTENAAYAVKNQLRKVSLKEAAMELLIEYKPKYSLIESSEIDTGLIGHLHLNERLLSESNIGINEVLEKCEAKINSFRKKKKVSDVFKRIILGASSCCSFQQSSIGKSFDVPCLKFIWQETEEDNLEGASHILADVICPVLLGTIIKGDPRISAVDMIWSSPDTPNWMRSLCKSQKGELVLDVIIEKDAIKQAGDAWRIVMDSCLPIIHLIDTKRSIPYAIKQVQELLGISCAFEQAVQRLSTSVTMVTKGVLKDHLVLLANSMTYSGNLIGFNRGGIKALSRSLNVQVPFTEATSFAPRKCFETAAEKCHVDNLSSIVASCAWGKQVAVGTGSAFDILLDTRKVDLNQPDGVDVYDFLHLVRSNLNVEETATGCIGAEIDNLYLEVESVGDLSPLRDSEMPTFEDKMEFEDGQRESGWDNDQNLTAKSSWVQATDKVQNGAWDQSINKSNNPVASQTATDSTWSCWAKSDVAKESTCSKRVEVSANVGWGTNEQHETSAWGKMHNDKRDSGWGDKEPQSSWKQSETSAQAKKQDSETDSSWKQSKPSAWGKMQDSEGDSGWGAKEPQSSWKQSETSAQAKKQDSETDSSWKQSEPSAWEKMQDSERDSGWGAKEPQSIWKQSETYAPAKKQDSETDSSWTQSKPSDWGKMQDSRRDSSWGAKEAQNSWKQSEPSAWGKLQDSGSGAKEPQSSSKESEPSAWGKMQDSEGQSSWKKSGSSPSWEKKLDSTRDSLPTAKSWGNEDLGACKDQNIGAKKTSDAAWSAWSNSEGGKQGDSTKVENNFFGGSERGNNNKRNRPPKPPAESSGGTGLFTKTRQRLDLFTADEQDILADVEPMMEAIRKIMNQTGYNDGDPLSSDDQSYMVNNVLNHHPDKAIKIGAGINYVMVSKHANFQESRCFYVVSVDGHKQDFSYRKSLEHFIKEKYPDKAEAFVAKYFRKPQPRPGWNRERVSTPDGTGTGTGTPPGRSSWGGKGSEARNGGWSSWGGKSSEAGTPGGSGWGGKDSEAGSPGWSNWGEKGTEAGTPGGSGWGGKDSEAGTPGWSSWGGGKDNESGTPSGGGGKDFEAGTPVCSGWSGKGSEAGTPGGVIGWGGKDSEAGTPGWKDSEVGTPSCSGWGKDYEAGTPGTPGWNSMGKDSEAETPGGGGGWT